MMKSEFENLAGREVTDEQYRAIETLYMSSNLEKTEFVKSMKPILKNIPQPEKKKDMTQSMPSGDMMICLSCRNIGRWWWEKIRKSSLIFSKS